MKIFRASSEHAPVLSAIAWKAKASWGYPADWLEEWRDQLTMTPEFIAANPTFAARIDERIVGFHALLQSKDKLRLEHLWILPEWMGQGIGRRLFAHAAEQAIMHGAPCLTIEADPHAEAFYLHLGALRIGLTTSEIKGRSRELPLLEF